MSGFNSFDPSSIQWSVAAGQTPAASQIAAAICSADCSMPIEQFVARNNAMAALGGVNPGFLVAEAEGAGRATGGIVASQDVSRSV
jgi:hypothetical protein